MAQEDITGYELSRSWFDWCFENPDFVKPIHTAIFFFAIEHRNRLGWKQKFGLPTQMTMDAIGVKNWRTYSSAFEDIVNWGFFQVHQRSKNQYSATVIAIVKNTKAHTKALSKATQKHSQKQSSSTVVIDNTINSIITIEPKNQEREETPEKMPENFELNYLNNLDETYNAILTDQPWLEIICMNNHLASIEIAKQYVSLFFRKLQNEGAARKSIADFKSHFARWLNIELQKQNKEKHGAKKTTGLTTEAEQFEFLDAIARGILNAEPNRN